MKVRMQNGPAAVEAVVEDDATATNQCPATRSVGGGCHGYDDIRCERDAGHCGPHRSQGTEWPSEKDC